MLYTKLVLSLSHMINYYTISNHSCVLSLPCHVLRTQTCYWCYVRLDCRAPGQDTVVTGTTRLGRMIINCNSWSNTACAWTIFSTNLIPFSGQIKTDRQSSMSIPPQIEQDCLLSLIKAQWEQAKFYLKALYHDIRAIFSKLVSHVT